METHNISKKLKQKEEKRTLYISEIRNFLIFVLLNFKKVRNFNDLSKKKVLKNLDLELIDTVCNMQGVKAKG